MQRLCLAFLTLSVAFFPSNTLDADTSFLRGDANADGAIDVGDPLVTLFHLAADRDLPCLDAADADDSGAIDTTDAVFLLNFIFLSGSPPAPPFPRCGVDPPGVALGCESFPFCPQDPGPTGPEDAIVPARANVLAGGTQRFGAVFSDGGKTLWSVEGLPGVDAGSIDANGVYTAPQAIPDPPLAVVRARSSLDPALTAIATVVVVGVDDFVLTRDQAIQRVIEEVIAPLPNRDDVVAYATQEPLRPGDRILPFRPSGEDGGGAGPVVDAPCWFFMIDEAPGARFVHPVRYVFVDCETGERTETREQYFPLINEIAVWGGAADPQTSPDRVYVGSAAREALAAGAAEPAVEGALGRGAGVQEIPAFAPPPSDSACDCPGGPKKLALLVAGAEDFWFVVSDGFQPDIDRMRTFLIQSGFEVKTLSGVSGGISADSVVRELRELRAELRPCDLFLFYYSGHGSKLALGVASGQAIRDDDGPPADESGDLLYGTLNSELAAIVARRKIIIIDACEAEGLRVLLESRDTVVGAEMLMASSVDGYAYGNSQGGYYTQALIDCLPAATDLAAAHACAVLAVQGGLFGQDPKVAFSDPNDADSDGLSDNVEDRIGTEVENADSDGDGECDGLESLRLIDDRPEKSGFDFRQRPRIVTPGVELDALGDIASDAEVLELPVGLVGVPYPPLAVRTLFGTPPYRFAQSTNLDLPDGVSIRTNGVFSGEPAESGDFEFALFVRDDIGAFDAKLGRLTVLPAIAPGASITVSSNADNTSADDDITLREAVLLASGGTGPLGLGRPLRPDPDPDDGIPEGEERFVDTTFGGGPGLAFSDRVESAEGLGEIVLTQGPLVHVTDLDTIAVGSRIRAEEGTVFELRGNGNQLSAVITGPLAGGEPAVLVTGSDNTVTGSVADASGTAIVIDGGTGNEVSNGVLEGNQEGVRLIGAARGNRIDRVSILDSTGDAVVITGGSVENAVLSCGIGVRVAGVEVQANGGHGIRIDGGARFNRVSATTIAGSGGSGIRIEGPDTALNELVGNSVGGIRDRGGLTALAPNQDHGIVFAGGTFANSISGNDVVMENVGHGILITGEGTNINSVVGPLSIQGNTRDGIRVEAGVRGTRIGGSMLIGDSGENGITLAGASSTTISGDFGLSFLDLSVNGAQGAAILLTDGSTGNRVSAASVAGCNDGIVLEGEGTDDNEITDVIVRNQTNHGIVFRGGCRRNRLDGEGSSDPASPEFRTVDVGSNGGNSVTISGAGTAENEVRRCVLGNRRDGAHAVTITGGAANNLITGCFIVEHALGGVLLRGAGTNSNRVIDNLITGAILESELPLSGAGVIIDEGARQNLVIDNEILLNGGDGVRIHGGATRANVVAANRIGAIEVFEVAPGEFIEVPLPNGGNGILIEDAPENVIGSPFGGGNAINANDLNGIHILGATAVGNRVTGNRIGTETGARAAPNGINGVSLTDGARANTIGGVRPVFNPLDPALPHAPDIANLGAANLISANGGSGVRVSDAGVVRNKVLGNLIGFSFGETALANGGDGVTVSGGAADTCIGDGLLIATRDPGHANIIVDHPGAGVLVSGAESTGTTISRARLARNTQDILLVGGANGGVQPPVVTSFEPAAGRVSGVAPGGGIIEVFTDVPGDEGTFHLAAFVPGGAFTIDVLGGGSQNAVVFESAEPLRPGVLRLTYTDGAGNTSEFAVAP